MSIEQKIKFPSAVILQWRSENKKNRIQYVDAILMRMETKRQRQMFLAPSSSVYGNFIDLSCKSHGNEMKILNLTQILNFQVGRACPDQRGSDMRCHALLESCIAQFCLVSSLQCTGCKAMPAPNPCGSILRCRIDHPAPKPSGWQITSCII